MANGEEISPMLTPSTQRSSPLQYYVSDPTAIRVHDDLLRKRRVYIVGEIEELQAALIIGILHWLDDRSKAPITIYIDSPGGDLYQTNALVDTIRTLRSPTTTVGIGMVASGAAVLLQAGNTRMMGKRGWFLIHEISSALEGTTTQQAEEIELMKRLQQQMLDLLAERAKISRKTIEENWKKKDWTMTSQEALKAGLIDGILEEGWTVTKGKKAKSK